jgi:ribonuclease BN (tRNA processing enzyme)
MIVRVLGCSGSIAARKRTTAFLLGERLLIDAGTGVGDLELDELRLIDHVLLSHSHLDHITSIPLLADTVMRQRTALGLPPIQVHALPETLEALRRHVFNNVIWPDFTVLPSAAHPVLSLTPFEIGQRLTFGACAVEVLPAVHTVPAVGFAAWAGNPQTSGCWVFSGDTGPNPQLWRRLADLQVAQLVIETAFSDQDSDVAERSQHLHPAALGRELAHLRRPTDVYITHIKPGEDEAVLGEIARLLQPHRIHALQTGERMPLGTAPPG